MMGKKFAHPTRLIFPETRLAMLIPGTFEDEITLIGFATLVLEPIAAVCSIQILLAEGGHSDR